MSEISVLLQDRKLAYRPGETVRGTAYWTLGGQPESVEVRLFWRTEGKGSTDTEIVASKTFQNPARTDRRDFELVLPAVEPALLLAKILVFGLERAHRQKQSVRLRERRGVCDAVGLPAAAEPEEGARKTLPRPDDLGDVHVPARRGEVVIEGQNVGVIFLLAAFAGRLPVGIRRCRQGGRDQRDGKNGSGDTHDVSVPPKGGTALRAGGFAARLGM